MGIVQVDRQMTILPLTQYFPASYDWNIGGGALPPLQISGSTLAP